MHLVTAWLEYRAGRDKTAAASARYLSARLSRIYTQSRLWEWEHGKRPLPGDVAALMREEVLPTLLDKAGFDDSGDRKKIEAILKVLLS